MYAFEMTLEAAIEFYKRKMRLGAKTEEQCTHILLQLAKEGYPITMEETPETKAEYLKRLAKEKKILHIKGKANERKTKGQADGGQAGTLGN